MALEFTTTEELTDVSGIKVLAYSESGAGKTVLCATAPAPIMLMAEGGALSLREANLKRIFGDDLEAAGVSANIPTIVISTVKDLEDAYEWLTAAKEMDDFQTICLDSFTEIAEKVLVNAKRLAKDPRQAYGDMAEKMIELAKKFRDIPGKNVVFLAKMEKSKDEVSGIMLYGPMMPGKQTGPQLPYLFDEVFRMGVGKEKDGTIYRFIQTGADMQYTAKDRSGALDPIEYPHLGMIFNKIKGI